MKEEMLTLTTEWDKTFPKSDKVDHKKVTFHNRYGITLAADMYIPKGAGGKLPAIAVSGPFGAVKEQCSGLYAQTLAERGFLTIAFDPSFTGESGGKMKECADYCLNVPSTVTNHIQEMQILIYKHFVLAMVILLQILDGRIYLPNVFQHLHTPYQPHRSTVLFVLLI